MYYRGLHLAVPGIAGATRKVVHTPGGSGATGTQGWVEGEHGGQAQEQVGSGTHDFTPNTAVIPVILSSTHLASGSIVTESVSRGCGNKGPEAPQPYQQLGVREPGAAGRAPSGLRGECSLGLAGSRRCILSPRVPWPPPDAHGRPEPPSPEAPVLLESGPTWLQHDCVSVPLSTSATALFPRDVF